MNESTGHSPDNPDNFDVVVIGGGPAGAAVATLVADAGHRVALVEKETFPRFAVGESLVPAVNSTLKKIGVLDAMDGAGFPQKHGVQFYSPKGPSRPFYFSESAAPEHHRTWQVLRSRFDALLLDNAKRHGVEVSTATSAVGLEMSTEGRHEAVTGLRIRSGNVERVLHAQVIVDAGGQRSPLAREFGGRTHIPGLDNAAVYAHYRGVKLDTGLDAGSTIIFKIGTASWFWFIPLPDDIVSVGLVAPAKEVAALGGPPHELLDNAVASCSHLAERLERAERTTEVRVARDYSYRAERDGGPGWMLVGDALGFMDPVYSTGLFLATHSAELAAEAIVERMAAAPDPDSNPNDDAAPLDFAGYSAPYQISFDRLLALVRAFYQEGFRFGELAREPEQRQGLVDLLIGNVGSRAAIVVAARIASQLETEDVGA